MGILSKALASDLENQSILTATFILGGNKFEVGARPLTPADFDYVNNVLARAAAKRNVAHVPFQQDPTDFGGQIALIIRKVCAVDADGALSEEKAFDMADKPMLNRQGVEVISGWFTELFKEQITRSADDAIEDAEGK